MTERVKRTYNLSANTVHRVREMAERYGVASSQDAVVELAIDELERRLRDAAEAAAWEQAASDPTFQAEVADLEKAFPHGRPGNVAGLTGPLRWAVIIVDLDPVEGHEQAGARRALVVSYEPFHRSGLATICPITAARSVPRYPGDVPIATGEAGQTRDGMIVTSQVRTVSLN